MRAFLGATTQWKAIALANGRVRYLGLDYAGALAGIAAAGIEMTPTLWEDVRTVEIAALAELNGEAR